MNEENKEQNAISKQFKEMQKKIKYQKSMNIMQY